MNVVIKVFTLKFLHQKKCVILKDSIQYRCLVSTCSIKICSSIAIIKFGRK